MTENENDSDLARFSKELNDSGFGFQHAVVQALPRLGYPLWKVIATEYPVAQRDKSTHIDILANFADRALLIGECKRANPAFADWFFAQSPFTYEARNDPRVLLEVLHAPDPTRPVAYTSTVVVLGQSGMHIPMEVKTRAKGDAKGRGRSLREALDQVELGVNGLVTTLVHQRYILEKLQRVVLVPVVFTTARLFMTEVALQKADLETGHVPPAEFTECDWLWFEDNVSPGLVHEVQRDGPIATTLAGLLPRQHSRGIAIVSARGVGEFLRQVGSVFYDLLPNAG